MQQSKTASAQSTGGKATSCRQDDQAKEGKATMPHQPTMGKAGKAAYCASMRAIAHNRAHMRIGEPPSTFLAVVQSRHENPHCLPTACRCHRPRRGVTVQQATCKRPDGQDRPTHRRRRGTPQGASTAPGKPVRTENHGLAVWSGRDRVYGQWPERQWSVYVLHAQR